MTESRRTTPGSRSTDDADAAAARQIFDAHMRFDSGLDEVEVLGARLPDRSAVLFHLQALCMSEARKALAAGHHTEGRRFSNLARQLQRLGEDGT